MRILNYTARPAADCTAAAAISTAWIPCFGARMVIFEWSATNANLMQNAAVPVETADVEPGLLSGVSPGTGWGTASGNPASITAPSPALASFALNGAQGPLRIVVVPSTGTFLNQRWMRMNATGHATLVVAQLACNAIVVFDGDAAVVGPGTTAV